MQARHIPGGIQQGDTLGTAPHIAVHGFVPQFIGRAGRRVRALDVDQKLIVVGVFIQPRHGGQKISPRLIAACDAWYGFRRYLGVGKGFYGHMGLLSLPVVGLHGIHELQIVLI